MINPNFEILLKEARDQERGRVIRILEKVKNTFDATGFLCVDHDLPVLYLVEAKAAIDCGIDEIREKKV